MRNSHHTGRMVQSLLLLLLVLLPSRAAAQLLHPHRHVPPAPKMTPAVRQIRVERKLFSAPTADVELPKSVDNSKQIYFPPLINQTGGSCAQASGIGYMFTYEMNRLLNRDASRPENRMSYLFAWNMINEGENQGGFVEQGLQLAKSFGIMSEADYGTPGLYGFMWATGYEKYVRAMHNRALEILTFDDDISLIKRYLYDAGRDEHPGGIVTFSTLAEGWNFDTHYQGPSETDYHALLTRLGNEGPHALTIVGYDDLVIYTDEQDKVHTGAFIVCNTWGDYYYHDQGRFYLPYDFFRDESIPNAELSNSMNAVRVMTYEPRVIMRVGLTYNQRNELRFGISSTNNRDAVQPSVAPRLFYIMYHQGGAYPMQGQYKLKDMDVAFDASAFAPEDVTSVEQYFLHVIRQAQGNKKSGEGQVTAMELIDLAQPDVVRRWTYHGVLPAEIKAGANTFAIPLRPRYRISVSPYAWNATNPLGGNNATYRLCTVHGRQTKFIATENADGKHLHLHYAIKE